MTGLQKLSQKIESQKSQTVSTFGKLSDRDSDGKRAMIEALKAEVKNESAGNYRAAFTTAEKSKGEW